jgi:hypothetical protein
VAYWSRTPGDHEFLKGRFRANARPQADCVSGNPYAWHALMRNIRHGFYGIVEFVPHQLVVPWSWNRVVQAV